MIVLLSGYKTQKLTQTEAAQIMGTKQLWCSMPKDKVMGSLLDAGAIGCFVTRHKARSIYDYVVSTMKYDKTGYGWGRGDLQYACSVHKGNCTDFHA